MEKNRTRIRNCGRFFREDIAEAGRRAAACSGGSLLKDQAREDILDDFGREISRIADSTVKKILTEYIAEENPFVRLDFNLSTAEEEERAAKRLEEELASGETQFPPLLVREVRTRLAFLADGVCGMLEAFALNRQQISAAIFDGNAITSIRRIRLFVGDSHNGGRGAAIFVMDAGPMMVKPRSGLTDTATYQLVEKYFADTFRVPKCWTDGKNFTACEFIQMERAEGREQSAAFYRHMGGMTAVLHVLGSSDMHVENISCVGDMPVILDIETILTPAKKPEESLPEADLAIAESALMTGLHAGNVGELVASPLLNTKESGCAPVVDGRRVSVLEYENEYLQGFVRMRERIAGIREELSREIERLYGQADVRVLLRNTEMYMEWLLHMYLAKYFVSEEAYAGVRERMQKLSEYGSDDFASVCHAELQALSVGDVPLFTVPCSSRSLYAAGTCVWQDMYGMSPLEHARWRLSMVSDEDTQFQLRLLQRFFTTALVKEPAQHPVRMLPKRAALPDPLSPEAAGEEGLALLEELYRDMLTREDGSGAFVLGSSEDGSIVRMQQDLYQGYAGLGIFAEEALLSLAEECRDEAVEEQERGRAGAHAIYTKEALSVVREAWRHTTAWCREMEAHLPHDNEQAEAGIRISPGEGNGIGGMLRFFEMTDRARHSFAGNRELLEELPDPEALVRSIPVQAVRAGIAAAGISDQIGGLAGLLSALCDSRLMQRIPETEELVQAALERLLLLQTLPYTYPDGEKVLLWNTIRQKRPVSGRGHGMAGIAEALVCAAAYLVSRETMDEKREKGSTEEHAAAGESRKTARHSLAARALSAAETALTYEDRVYREDLETWPDLRLKQTGAMHGLCSGAPGIGISMMRIERALGTMPEDLLRDHEDLYILAERNRKRAEEAVSALPLLYRDHLCCGNAAIVWFLLESAVFSSDMQHGEEGRRKREDQLRYAGRILAAMKARRDAEGAYVLTDPGYRPVENHTLFYGTSGVGLVMLRYAELAGDLEETGSR